MTPHDLDDNEVQAKYRPSNIICQFKSAQTVFLVIHNIR